MENINITQKKAVNMMVGMLLYFCLIGMIAGVVVWIPQIAQNKFWGFMIKNIAVDCVFYAIIGIVAIVLNLLCKGTQIFDTIISTALLVICHILVIVYMIYHGFCCNTVALIVVQYALSTIVSLLLIVRMSYRYYTFFSIKSLYVVAEKCGSFYNRLSEDIETYNSLGDQYNTMLVRKDKAAKSLNKRQHNIEFPHIERVENYPKYDIQNLGIFYCKREGEYRREVYKYIDRYKQLQEYMEEDSYRMMREMAQKDELLNQVEKTIDRAEEFADDPDYQAMHQSVAMEKYKKLNKGMRQQRKAVKKDKEMRRKVQKWKSK